MIRPGQLKDAGYTLSDEAYTFKWYKKGAYHYRLCNGFIDQLAHDNDDAYHNIPVDIQTMPELREFNKLLKKD